MASFIATRLLYAVLFFLFGAWTASVAPPFKEVMRQATATSMTGFEKAREWTLGTLRATPQDEKAPAPAPSAPAPVKTAAAPAPVKMPPAPAPAAPPAEQATPVPPANVTQASAPAPAETTAEEVLVRAREAYAIRDMIGAINAYRAYMDRNPDAIDARGELGNVYFAVGRWHDAAEMYLEAAALRLKAGDIAGAKALLDTVRQVDASMGLELGQQITQAESKDEKK